VLLAEEEDVDRGLVPVGAEVAGACLVDERPVAVGGEQLDDPADPLRSLDHQRGPAACERLAQAFEHAELGTLDVDLDEGRRELELVEAAQVDLDLL